ncbi:hypothetical protein ANN_23606 [Periplaneta americana]|uniref:Uncharacterized protein n=1 Tax=Periplaneta americana TaxID=6978 RepID=A0ABQ8SM05_PERAM|nr:hypothetical protein ANN_23606 [Periplaneta americana]
MAGFCEGGNEPPGSLKAISYMHQKVFKVFAVALMTQFHSSDQGPLDIMCVIAFSATIRRMSAMPLCVMWSYMNNGLRARCALDYLFLPASDSLHVQSQG